MEMGPDLDMLFIKEEPELFQVKVEPTTEDPLDITDHPEIENMQESNALKEEPTTPPGTPTHSTTLDNITSQLDQATHESPKTQLQFDLQREVYVKKETIGDRESLDIVQHDPDTELAVKYNLKSCVVHLSRSLVSNRVFDDLTQESSKTQLQPDVYVKRKSVVQKCVFCNKVFSRKDNLQKHLATHSDKRDHKCVECGECFKYPFSLRRHKQTHKKPQFVCSVCDKLFVRNDYLKLHLLTHSNVRDKKCDQCGKCYITSDYLRKHQLTHTPRVYVCAHCSKMFTQKHTLTRHIKHQHMRESDRIRHTCSICSKSYSYNYNLTKHMKTHNLQHCEICNLECANLLSLRTHMTVAHKGEKKTPM